MSFDQFTNLNSNIQLKVMFFYLNFAYNQNEGHAVIIINK